MEDKNKHSIPLALGISEEWIEGINERMEDLLSEKDLISEVITTLITETRIDELDANGTATTYEKKLFLAGFYLAQEIKHREAVAKRLAKVMKKLFKDLEDED